MIKSFPIKIYNSSSKKIMPEELRMNDQNRLIFIHGLMGNSMGVKASLLREKFTDILTPDFDGSLDKRMQSLREILSDKVGWTIIGSSFGGLMAAIYASECPHQVKKLILLAPALIWPEFAESPPEPIAVPVVLYHGTADELIPVEQVRNLAESVFINLTFNEVEDDHGLFKTVHALDWETLVHA
jgi:pimeloyl-ACP methyl ester carboxylesterase